MDHHHQPYNPPAQPHQFYPQSAEDYYPYTYYQPHPYHIFNMQSSPPRGEQEPNPPPVFLQPPQPGPTAYYRNIGYRAAAYNVDAGFATVHQPIVQSSYNNGHGHGRGKHQVQTVLTQVGPSQPSPQSYGPTQAPLTGQAQSSSPRKRMCELCKVECNTPEILNQHNSGKKHMKKLKTFEESQKTSGEKSSLPSQDINEVEKRKVEEAKPLWCELCKANCNTLENFNKHLNGRKHQKKMKTSENLSKSRPELKPSQPEKQTLPSLEVKEESKACGSKRKTKGGKVRNVRSRRPAEPPLPKEATPLLCELCQVKCESQVAFQSHIVGKNHLLNAKRFLSENKTLGQEVSQILKHAIQALEQNAPTVEANLESVRAKDVGGGVAM